MATATTETTATTKKMTAFVFDSSNAKKIERTSFISGKVIYAEDYTTTNKGLPGVSLQIEGIPYQLRILKNSIKGAGNAATLMGCEIRMEGNEREYEGKTYFNPLDCLVTKQSGLAKIASANVAFAGSLD
jgi:hypothetical protein